MGDNDGIGYYVLCKMEHRRKVVDTLPRQKRPKYEYVPAKGLYRKRIKDIDGKYVEITAKSPEVLDEKVREAQELIEHASFRKENPLVRDYAEKWLTMHSAHVRPTTMIDYTSCVKIYIIGKIGDMYMSEVRPDDVKMAIVEASKKSTSIYRKTQMLFKMIFQSAVDSGIIDKNPCENLNPKGGIEAKEKTALTDKQMKTLLESVKGLPVETFVMLGLYAGLRREESLGLKWENVFLDTEAPHLSVQTAWHTEHNRPVITTNLKTKAARRNIPIPKPLLDHLAEKKKAAASDFVIANSDGNPLSETQWQRLWKYVVTRTTKERTYTRYDEKGAPVKHEVKPVLGQSAPHNPGVVYTMDFVPTPHQLRHTYITNLLLAGVDVKTVQYLAGHEHAKITLDIYAHLTYNRPEDLKQKIDSAFGK